MNKKYYVDKLFEAYSETFVRSKEYQKISEKICIKYDEMIKKFSKEEIKDVEEFENYLTKLFEIEVKDAFNGGFNVAIELVLDKK